VDPISVCGQYSIIMKGNEFSVHKVNREHFGQLWQLLYGVFGHICVCKREISVLKAPHGGISVLKSVNGVFGTFSALAFVPIHFHSFYISICSTENNNFNNVLVYLFDF